MTTVLPKLSEFEQVQIDDPDLAAMLIDERRSRGIDPHDEVWNGVYVIFPPKDNEHQEIGMRLAIILSQAVDDSALGRTYQGINVSDRGEDWLQNVRCPDVATFCKNGSATNCRSHWLGGPDLAIEIVSPYDRSREKVDFYAEIGTRELLVVDRDPWQLELLRLDGGKLASVGVCTLDAKGALVSERTSLAFKLVSGDERSQIAVEHTGDGRTWIV